MKNTNVVPALGLIAAVISTEHFFHLQPEQPTDNQEVLL